MGRAQPAGERGLFIVLLLWALVYNQKGSPLPKALVDTYYLKAPRLCCRAALTTSSFSSWQTEHVE